MRQRRIIRKDHFLGIRMPQQDRERLNEAARYKRRAPSDLAWVLIADGLDAIETEKRTLNERRAS